MVSAPRRCLRCAQSSIQCDGKSPCAPCQRACLPCQHPCNTPGNAPGLSALVHRSRSTQSPVSSSISGARSSSQKRLPVSRFARKDARYANVLPIDNSAAPSLVAKTVSAQQTQLFINFVLSAFPCYFKATETRVPINWVEYVDARRGVADSPFDWAIRSMTTMYTGHLYGDPRYLHAGRELYTRALRGMSGLLSDVTTAKSDNTIATAITLTLVEMHSCNTAQGWMHHTSGIRALMLLRGPKAHRHGFGAAVYIACRTMLVASALVAGDACFLEEPEWQELNEQIAAENAKQPNSSVYTDITERAFREVVKLPGFVKSFRDLSAAAPDAEKRKRTDLLRQVLATRAALRGIHTEFSMSVSTLRAGHEPEVGFIGPMPYHFFDRFSTLSIRGIRSGILLLNYLIILLDPFQRPAAEAENRIIISDRMRTVEGTGSRPGFYDDSPPLTPPGSPGRAHLVVESMITPETRQPPTTDWLDRIASTMGMEGTRVSLIDDH